MDENRITSGSIPKQMLAFFFPIWFGTFFQFFYNTADAVIVGQFLGKEALAAVGGPASTIVNLIVNFFVGVASGSAVIISQYYGAKNGDKTNRAVHTAIALAIVGGALLGVLGFVFSPAMLGAMGTPEDVIGYAVTYIRIYFAGMIFNTIYNVGSGILRAVGDSRRPLYFLILSSIVNVVLDLVFILVFKMGVAGAAWATIISQAVSAVLILISLNGAPPIYRLIAKNIKLDLPLLGEMVRIGLPAGMQSVMYSVSNILIQASINTFGTDAVAAWAVFGKVDAMFWMTISSFGLTATTFAGQNFGAKKYDRLKQSVRIATVLAVAFTAVVEVILYIFGPECARLFTADASVIEWCTVMMRFTIPWYITYILIEIIGGAVRGTGDAIVPMIISCIGICVLRSIWLYTVVPLNHDVRIVCASYPVTWVITSIVFIIYYKQGSWLKRSIKRASDK